MVFGWFFTGFLPDFWWQVGRYFGFSTARKLAEWVYGRKTGGEVR
jgi:hypothetical protein